MEKKLYYVNTQKEANNIIQIIFKAKSLVLVAITRDQY